MRDLRRRRLASSGDVTPIEAEARGSGGSHRGEGRSATEHASVTSTLLARPWGDLADPRRRSGRCFGGGPTSPSPAGEAAPHERRVFHRYYRVSRLYQMEGRLTQHSGNAGARPACCGETRRICAVDRVEARLNGRTAASARTPRCGPLGRARSPRTPRPQSGGFSVQEGSFPMVRARPIPVRAGGPGTRASTGREG
jgi:hypothetical protein